jgi:peptidoglycan/LPS O-acetylase OafA/YrhL
MKKVLIPRQLRRITSNGSYVPEIDGLRFIAVAAVVLYHIHGYWIVRTKQLLGQQHDFFMDFWTALTATGNVGVQLFFVISGYILGLPFANKYLGNGRDVPLGKYFKRRITRLEPPYIILLLIFFALFIITHKYTFSTLFPSLLASLTYTHNFIYGRETLPMVNYVAWSLEIEVQFYILAPLLARVFLLPLKTRRAVILLTCVLFIFLQKLYPLPFISSLTISSTS